MRKLIKYFLICALLCPVFVSAQEQTKHLNIALSHPGQAYGLAVNILHGSISVSSYDGETIQVEISTTLDEENRRPVPTVSEQNNQVIIRSGGPGTPINLILKIPRKLKRLKLSTKGQGDITVNNVSGELEVNNQNGDIELTNISGSAIAGLLNGKISASFKAVDPQAPMAFSTLNGDIEVAFPPGLKANTRIKSSHGEIRSELVIIPKIAKAPDWAYGKIGGGGPEIQFSNLTGNITIRQMK